MSARLRVLLFFPFAALLACGSSSSSNIPAGGAQSGDYVLTVAPGTAAASPFIGALTVTGTSVAGAFTYSNTGTFCVSPSQVIPVSGSVVNGTLKLTSASFSGSVATITFPVPLVTNTSGQQTSTGNVVIAGGPCALTSSAMVAQLIPNFSGIWNGTFGTTPASFTLTESTASPNQASLPLSATGSFCGSTVALTGSVTGTNLQLSSSNSTITLTASPGTSFNSLNVTETCPSGTATGTFTD